LDDPKIEAAKNEQTIDRLNEIGHQQAESPSPENLDTVLWV
jgi:hypothetical protein